PLACRVGRSRASRCGPGALRKPAGRAWRTGGIEMAQQPGSLDEAGSHAMSLQSDPGDVTRLLRAAADGQPAAMDQVVQGLYQALRQLAAAQLGRERHDPMLSATVLINEAWLKLFAGAPMPPMESRGHLLGLAAHAMRQVLIDHARLR